MAIFCRLYGWESTKYCKEGWIYMLYLIVTKGEIFNWEDILAQKLQPKVSKVKKDVESGKNWFLIFSHLLDEIFVINVFLGIKWNWTQQDPPLFNMYCMLLSKYSYRGVYERLFEHYFVVLYQIILKEGVPCISDQNKEVISDVENWFASTKATYIMLFSYQKPPHLLTKYVTNKVIMQELHTSFAKGYHSYCKRKRRNHGISFLFKWGIMSWKLWTHKKVKMKNYLASDLVKWVFTYMTPGEYVSNRMPSYIFLGLMSPCLWKMKRIKKWYNAFRETRPGDEASPSNTISITNVVKEGEK